MKTLRKLLLINWHFFVHETIELKRLNFLTGKTGSGKSTIIDALQLLVLGDTSGYFFNKAANEQSRRSLKSYLQGEVAENEEEGVVYLRQGKDFSSYIVGEFYDSQEKKSFCLGIVFDSYADGGKEEHRFFYWNGALPDNHFLVANTPLGIRGLREWARQKTGSNFRYYDSNATYREHFRHLMGGLGEKFFSLFRKAVPFSPIMDIKDFIANFVCNISGKVEIDDMRENIRYYKQLEGELDQVKRRIAGLQSVERTFVQYSEAERRRVIQRFMLARAEIERSRSGLEANRLRYQATERDLAELRAALEKLDAQRLANEQQVRLVNEEKARCEAQRQKEFLDAQLRQAREKLARLKENQRRLSSLLHQWAEASEKLAELSPGLNSFVKVLRSENAGEQAAEFWQRFQSEFRQALETVREQRFQLRKQLDQEQEAIGLLRSQVEKLQQGVKSYEPRLLELAEAIRRELSEKEGKPVLPRIFADLLEVRDPRWRNAIEGFLHTQKFYLLIEPQYFVRALQIYDRLKHERKFYDIGLVDLGKLQERVRPPRPGSLAEEVLTEDPLARLYADFLLGGVMKVERVEELRRFPTAITPVCMLYRGFVARQLHPDRYAVPYIGQKAIAEQIRIKQQELALRQAEQARLAPRLAQLGEMATIEACRQDDIERIGQAESERREIGPLQREIVVMEDELGRLDLNKVYQLEERLRSLDNERERIYQQNRQTVELVAEKKSANETLRRDTIPTLEEALAEQQAQLNAGYPAAWQEETGEPKFREELARLGSAEKLQANFGGQLARSESQREEKWNELVRLRSDFNRDFRSAMEVTQPSNAAWQQELARLEQTCLPEYEAKILGAKEQAQREFQEDFISKLRQNIEMVRSQIDELNAALKDVPFGRSRYRFRVTANGAYREYYDMIMDEMLMEGFTLFSGEFQARYRPVVEQLFSRIVATSDAELTAQQREELERNLLKFTDYRTYLDFDLLDIDEEGRESRLSKTIGKKSGGETQTPFYIAVLASFLQTYRVSQTGHNNTLRLLVFDEAFSKMDHQRIQESIRLLDEVGLQVIIAAPTDNIADIAPLVERNLCVTRVRRETQVKAFDPRDLE